MATPTVTPPADDPGRLVRDLTAARVLAPDAAAPVLAEFRGTGVGGGRLADFLVQAGLLTPYQAERALAGAAHDLAVGPYLLLEPVGAGSLGTVYRAVRAADRARFAVKLLPLRSMWNVLQAKRQVGVFAGLPPHPAVVPFVDIDTAGRSHYLAWPFVEGETFDRLVRRVGPLAPAHAARFLADVADGLAVCHGHGIVHGLLKPSNLLLGPDHRAKILDLGIGAILSENVADDESLLDTISMANTAMTMLDCAAPETFNDPTARTAAGDVYSLGCVLYYLLTGSYPFPDGNAVDKIIAHQTQDPVPVRDRTPAVPAALDRLVADLMRKDPAGRPADLRAVRDTLLAAVSADQPAPVAPAPPPGPGGAERAAVSRGGADRPAAHPAAEAFAAPAPRDGTADSVNFDVPALVDTFFHLPAQAAADRQPTLDRVTLDAPDAPPTPAPPGQNAGLLRGFEPPPAPAHWTADAARLALPLPLPPTRPGPPRRGVGFWWRVARLVFPFLSPRDAVQYSVFGAVDLVPGQTYQFQVYAHAPAAFASVRTLSRAFQPDTELLGAGHALRPLRRDEETELHLSVVNAGVTNTTVRAAWAGQTRPVSFRVFVPWESRPGRAPAALTVSTAAAAVAHIPFEVTVRPRHG